MTRRDFLCAPAVSLAARRPAPPNVLLILADDLGYGDLGCYGQQRILTPYLDRLASEGIRFTQAYAGSTVCAPSRCALMTGLHTGHAWVRGNRYPDLPLRPQDLTLTEILKKAGYRTALFGKWSLGGLATTGYPTRRGFDEWFGYFSQTQAHDYYPYLLLEGEREYLVRGNFGARKTVWVHDLFTERALDFIRRRPQPFFLHLCWTIPHANNELGRDTGNGMEVPSDEPYSRQDWPQPEKNFAAMITRMDADVGKLMEALRDTGQDENTIVIFSSDNGPHREGGHDPDFFDSNGPLRGIKRDLYEGGIRVPMIVRWPARIRPGQVSDQVWAFWDLLPTLAEAAGLTPPPGLDGISMLNSWIGRPQRNHDYLYWEFHEGGFKQAVRMGDWKAVRLAPGRPLELYDLSRDPGETHDLARERRDVVERIERVLAHARTESAEFPVRASARG
ncbi:MAG: arylsulfatase [Bryobacterales bacterium]|nr:arylsulfatase [Bryobacteraceae bacterium]MDW8131344.1 arylsulfatase [Bryobacterales bacterium]